MSMGAGLGAKAVATTRTSYADDATFGAGNANKVNVLARNTSRLFAVLTAPSGNKNNIRVGDSDVDTAQGIQLQAGDSMLWQCDRAVYVCAEGGVVGDNSIAMVDFT